MHPFMCCECGDAGYLGFINPHGWLAGEIGDCRWLQWLIKRECPKCRGEPQSQIPPRPPPPPPPPPYISTREIMECANALTQAVVDIRPISPPSIFLGPNVGRIVDFRETIERHPYNRHSTITRTETRIVSDVELADSHFTTARYQEPNHALAAAEKAVTKAEAASEKCFEGINEFRTQLADRQASARG